MRNRRRPYAALLVFAAVLAGTAGCTDAESDGGSGATPTATASEPESSSTGSPSSDPTTTGPDEPVARLHAGTVPRRLRTAVSTPVEDSMHPESGDPGVDVLSYDLDLAWAPDSSHLTGTADLVVRSATDQDTLRLDLSKALTVAGVEVAGRPAPATHAGNHLEVAAPFRAGRVYSVVVTYDGRPRPILDENDFPYGVQVLPDGGLSTCQEPNGAATWYPVNDQPADKAYYRFTLRVPSPMVGVANGRLRSRTDEDGTTTTRWVLDQPTSSYLTTLAFGDLTETTLDTVGGTPVSTWTPRSNDRVRRRLDYADDALRWVEDKLGDYPFASLGLLANKGSACGMETQTMITLGTNTYVTSRPVIVHEIAHQWWGDTVTPTDWRDAWMNEGMAYYLQQVYEAETTGRSLEAELADVRRGARRSIKEAGPPGAYTEWGLTLYDVPALMWHDIRGQIGDELFWRLTREWPLAHRYGNASREDLIAWWSTESGVDLEPTITSWLAGEPITGS